MKLRRSTFAHVIDSPSVEDLLRQGLSHHQAGQPVEAARLYEKALKSQPNHPDGLHLLGVAKLQTGDTLGSIEHLRRAIQLRPKDPSFWLNLGNALFRAEAPGEAIHAYDRSIALQPENAEAHFNRANVWAAGGDHEAAIEGYEQALSRAPHHVGAHFNLANSLMALQREADALGFYLTVAQAAPDFPNLWTNVGICLANLKQYGDAENAFHAALRQAPEDSQAHNNLGTLLAKQERWDEAIEALSTAAKLQPTDLTVRLNLARTLQRARRGTALFVAEGATVLAPNVAETWVVLGDTRLAFGMTEAVLEAYEHALRLDPECLFDSNNLGLAYYRNGRLDEAIAFYDKVLERRPGDADAWADLGVARLHQGDVEGAIGDMARSIEIRPENEFAHSNYLLCHCYSHRHSAEDIRDLSMDWAKVHTPVGGELPPVRRERGDRLRVGYLSADFHAHPAGNLYAAMFPFHDPERVEVYAYSTNPFRDEVTERIESACRRYEVVEDLAADELAAKVRADEIDVWVDLLGHTPGHRLRAFGLHPAPVQASWLGYFGTTGMSQMDFLLADRHVVPERHEAHFTEHIARFPSCMYAYQPPQLEVEPGTLPRDRNGFVTFGCFNNLSKIHEGVVALWCEALRELPGSRIVLNRWPFSSPSTRERYWRWFEANGVSRDRVDLRFTKGREAYFGSYADVDLMLDSFPYGGGTTTSDALWMGVPVVSLSAERFVGRMTETILHAVGVPELLPASETDFVRMAVDLAEDSNRLGEYRATLRGRLVQSPLCDVRRFTRELEDVFEWMWEHRAR
jgi:predicted O-linked N-acetylglucosamine transferase (SPINDLY family)